MSEVLEAEDIYPLHADFGPAMFRPYVLDLQGLGFGSANVSQCLAFVVLLRRDGALLALPELAMPGDALAAGDTATPSALVGPHLKTEVGAAWLDEVSILQEPTAVEGRSIPIELVDFSTEVMPFLKSVERSRELSGVLAFDFREPLMIPHPDALVARALEWARGDLEAVGDRILFYSADDVPETPGHLEEGQVTPEEQRRTVPPPGGRRKPATPRAGKGASPVAAKKKPTVAALAQSLEEISQTLPVLVSQVQSLSDRTAAMEATTTMAADRTSALRKPIGSLALPGSTAASPLKNLVLEMPPPKAMTPTKPRVTFNQNDTEEMALDLPEASSDFARAMLAQSQALTALVAQIANGAGDPFHDLGSATGSMSSKGSLGRARLQAELAAHRGTFFTSVLQSMSRRMYPAQSAEVEISALRDRGVTPTQYLERFGGFGRTRDIGFIIWQVALALNHMQEENFLAAKDALALLFVCLEQTAMDNGKMEVGLLLALVEDPPHSLFSGRSVAVAANPRPFAPTASQRWVTTALQYLKEMDVISTRRAEVTSSTKTATTDANNAAPGPKKKGKGKGGPKSKASQPAHQLEEE